MCLAKQHWHNPMLMRLDQAIPSLLQEISTQITNEMKLLRCLLEALENSTGFGVMYFCPNWMGECTPFVVEVSVLCHKLRL